MEELISILEEGGIAVIPTDTIYGIVTLAHDKNAVEKLYKLKKRPPQKPFIILINSIEDILSFGVKVTSADKAVLEKVWPGKVSVVLHGIDKNFEYLTRGTNSLAFRLPGNEDLSKLLKKVGPIVAPSANISGMEPAENIDQAKNYFGDKVDFYLDKGERKSPPSTLIDLDSGEVEIIRQGEVEINV